MRIIRPRTGLVLVSVALLATGVSSMAAAAQDHASQPLCYGTCPTNTRITQAFSLLRYGDEQLQVYHATVSAAVLGFNGAPTGTVAIKSDSTTLCTIVLSAGKGSCSPSPRALPPGIYGARGYYSGDAKFSSSASNTTTFQVRLSLAAGGWRRSWGQPGEVTTVLATIASPGHASSSGHLISVVIGRQ